MNHFDERNRYVVATFGLTWQDLERFFDLSMFTDQHESYLLPVVDFDPNTAWLNDEEEDTESDKALMKLVNEVMADAQRAGLDYVWFQGV